MKCDLISGKDFNNTVPLYDIDCIVFMDEVAPKGVELTDLSNDKDGSIIGWMEDNGVYKVSTQIEGQKILLNRNCIEMFANRKWLKRIEFKMADTTKTENMMKMFFNCEGLKQLDLSKCNTENVINMSEMFTGCKRLRRLDLSSFNTSRVIDMSFMFERCRHLVGIGMQGFNTQNVVDMIGMFSECAKLEDLNLVGFDMSKVEDMSYMFDGCSELKRLYISDKFAFCSKNTKTSNMKIRVSAFCG